QIRKERDERAKAANERKAQIEQLTQAKTTAEKLAQERDQQIEQIRKERDERAKAANERKAQIEQLTQAKTTAEKLVQEKVELLAQFTKTRDEQARLATERQKQIEQLTKAKTSAEKQLSALTGAASPCTAAANTLPQSAVVADANAPYSASPTTTNGGATTKRIFSSDANIDDFLNDLVPFFFEQSITYVDVGAFVGEIFIKFHQNKNFRLREAHLFEPNPESYKKLKDNINGINISKIHAYNHAIGKQESDLSFSAARSMTKIIRTADTTEQQTGVFHAKCHKLDTLVNLFTDQHIHLLKIDVEGAELDVLQGAQKIFREQKVDVIYIEVGFSKEGTQQAYFADIDGFFQKFGYRVFKIYEQTNEWIQDLPVLRRCNFAYMSPRFAAANPAKAKQEIVRLKREIELLKNTQKGNEQ
ncbi:FkbM family methyltransferase, partial [Corticibacter populi]|uniref:FkbM family methyltransferase n=1 Tax=Corticibacter populi TaxID=1550736 RepID=UPI00102CADD5